MRTTRATDVVCRRGESQFGILLPDTAGDPASRLYGRLLEAASQTSFGTARQLTFASGLVEWRPDESGKALDARALAAVGRTRIERPTLAPATEAVTPPVPTEPSPRDAFQERLAREIDRARHLERPLALLVAGVDGIARIADAHGKTAAERVLEEVESRLRDADRERGDRRTDLARRRRRDPCRIHGRCARKQLFSTLHASLESDPATHLDRLALSAGISELAAGDDAAGLLDRRSTRSSARAWPDRARSWSQMAADEARD